MLNAVKPLIEAAVRETMEETGHTVWKLPCLTRVFIPIPRPCFLTVPIIVSAF